MPWRCSGASSWKPSDPPIGCNGAFMCFLCAGADEWTPLLRDEEAPAKGSFGFSTRRVCSSALCHCPGGPKIVCKRMGLSSPWFWTFRSKMALGLLRACQSKAEAQMEEGRKGSHSPTRLCPQRPEDPLLSPTFCRFAALPRDNRTLGPSLSRVVLYEGGPQSGLTPGCPLSYSGLG